MIDPGHGGKQHGAISESGVSEKDITLDIALRLRRLIENGSLEAFMTREAGQFKRCRLRKEWLLPTPTMRTFLFPSM